MKRLEFHIVAEADAVVCISKDEAALMRAMPGAPAPTVKVPLLASIEPSAAGYEDRADIVIVASWAAGPGSPNVDGLLWFLREVFPLLQSSVPWAVLRISGGSPPDSLLELARYGVHFEGHVPDLRVLYEEARVAISPLRFGSGVKLKTVEALQSHGPRGRHAHWCRGHRHVRHGSHLGLRPT